MTDALFRPGRCYFELANAATEPAVKKFQLEKAIKCFERIQAEFPLPEVLPDVVFQLGYLYNYLAVYDPVNFDNAVAKFQEFWQNPGMATTIPGMTSYAQLEENLGARGKRFSLADRVALRRYAMEIGDRHCGLCGACGGICPNGVEVPTVLRSLTYLEGYREGELARSTYRSILPGRNAAACGDCGRCLHACRLALPIRNLAREAHARLSG